MRAFVPVDPRDLLVMAFISSLVVGPPALVIHYTGDWLFLIPWFLLVVMVAICNAVCPPGIGGME